MSEWSLRLQTPTSQLTAQLPHGATIKVLREHVADRSDRPPRMPCCTTCESGSCPAAAAPVVTADPPTIDLLGP